MSKHVLQLLPKYGPEMRRIKELIDTPIDKIKKRIGILEPTSEPHAVGLDSHP